MTENYSLEELPEIASQLIKSIPEKILLFYGEMGVGKTTLIKEIVKQLEVDDVVTSPTFSLVNEYHSRKGERIYHFDFYRIEQEEEALDMGIDEYFNSNAWCLVEWPERIKNLVPLNAVEIHLSRNDNGTRCLEFKI
jgi:tRNA threonylcarbamoyladenosine biosynthesis protein TsaE